MRLLSGPVDANLQQGPIKPELVTDLRTGPDGNLFVVSLGDGRVDEILRAH